MSDGIKFISRISYFFIEKIHFYSEKLISIALNILFSNHTSALVRLNRPGVIFPIKVLKMPFHEEHRMRDRSGAPPHLHSQIPDVVNVDAPRNAGDILEMKSILSNNRSHPMRISVFKIKISFLNRRVQHGGRIDIRDRAIITAPGSNVGIIIPLITRVRGCDAVHSERSVAQNKEY